MYDDHIDYDEIRRRVNKRMLRWGGLAVHAVVWVVGVSMASLLLPAELVSFIAVGWLGLLGLHGVVLGMLAARSKAIQREIERERRRIYEESLHEKPKHSERLVLSNDGEVLEVVDEQDMDEKPKRDTVG